MKKLGILTAAGVLLMGCSHAAVAKDVASTTRQPAQISYESAQRLTTPSFELGPLKHIVTFRFRPDVSREKMNEVKDRFLNMVHLCRRNGIPYIESIEAGIANSLEGADQGMQLGFIVSFKSAGDRNYYVGQPLIPEDYTKLFDPAHLEFKRFVGPLLATPVIPNGAFVFDFSAERATP